LIKEINTAGKIGDGKFIITFAAIINDTNQIK